MPSVREVLGLDPLKLAIDVVSDPLEKQRRKNAQRRVDLYLDHAETHLREEVHRVFQTAEVRALIEPFIKMASSQSLFKRVVDEISRPVYSIPPRREVTGLESDQDTFRQLARECRLDGRMDLAVRLVNACNQVWLYYRHVPRLGVVLDVLTPNMVTVIEDPADPTRELGIIYDRIVRRNGKPELMHVFWDAKETFQFDTEGKALAFDDPKLKKLHGLPRMPFVSIKRRDNWGKFWDDTSGNDLECGQLAVSLVTALVLKLHKCQGEKQIVITGDINGVPKGQTLDGQGAIVAPDGTTITTLDLTTNPEHYLKTVDTITDRVAANHGLNRERMNQGQSANEDGLLERRADMIKVFRPAEEDGFEVLKMVSLEHPRLKLSKDASLAVDFGEFEARTDRKAQLDIWEQSRSMGLRNVLDDIKATNPEIQTDAEAWDELDKNMAAEADFILRRRALNIPEDATVDQPGQNAAANGAMGPLVRDKKMTKDEAADQAEGTDKAPPEPPSN